MADIKLSDLYKLIAEGNIEQAKEAMMQRDTYSGKEVCELLGAVMKRIDGLEAKIGFSGEINEENLEKIKEELKQKAGNIGSIKLPKDDNECILQSNKASALEKIGKINEAGELYFLSAFYYLIDGRGDFNTLFSDFCQRQKDKFNVCDFLEKYEKPVLSVINQMKDNKQAMKCLLQFYSKRVDVYEQAGDKESAEKDRKELQKILEKM